jgi:hypothetical protein
VCGGPANILARDTHSGTTVDCSRCGDFSISRVAATDFLPLQDLKQRALASHLIKRLQGPSRPSLTSRFFEAMPHQTLPTPAEAADNLLLWIAKEANGSPGKQVQFAFSDQHLQALIGVIGDEDLKWVGTALKGQCLVEGPAALQVHTTSLTSEGWLRVEELKRSHLTSRFAFFARKFDNADLDVVFDRCLRPAVAQTGYELRTVTQRAGLIDAIIEDEIRRCRFLIADLSDDNPGAYWEAGFAQGLGKTVIYVCRASKAGRPKTTHFDANHRSTVRWNLSSLDQTATELKAVIRNSLLGDAKQED